MSTGPARKTVIESLRVDGFGRFHDFELELSDGLNVLAGPNEAGKSTLWSFISAMLFGFERRNEAGRYEPVGGSAFGGELRLKTVGGTVIVRRQGSKRRVEGELILRDGASAALPDGRLDEARGQVSRELFGQVFSLTVDQLRTFSELAASEVSERLFAAAMQGAQRLPSALEVLRKEASELFLPRGQRPLNGWLRALHEVRARLEALGDRPASYASDLAQRARLEAELQSLEGELVTAQNRVRELERSQKSLAPFEALARAEAAQRDRPSLGQFPLEAAARVEGLVKGLREGTGALRIAEHELAALDASLEQAERALASRPQPEPVRAALRQWDTVLVRARELAAAMAQLEARKRQLEETLERLPVPKADLDWLLRVDASVAMQTELKSLRDRHTQAREERARVMAALGSAREELKRREERCQQLALTLKRIEVLDVGALEEVLTGLGQVDALLQHRANLAARYASASSQLQSLELPGPAAPRARFPLWLAGVSAVALLIFALAAWSLGGGPTGLLFGLVLSVVSVIAAWRDEQGTGVELLAWRRAQHHLHQQRAARKLELSELDSEQAELELRLGQALCVGGVATPSEVNARLAGARAQLDEQERRQSTERAQVEALDEAQRVRVSVKMLEAERARADAVLDVVQSEVDARLAPLGIAASLSPEAALDVVADLHRHQERALALEAQRAGLEADALRVGRAVNELTVRAGPLAFQRAGAEESPEVLASMLHDWLELDGLERARHAQLRTRREAAEAPLRQLQVGVAQTSGELEQLLAEAEVSSVEAFRHRASEAQVWAAAEFERRSARAALAALGADLGAAPSEPLDPARLAQHLQQATGALEEARARRERTLEALGRLRARLERAQVEEDAAALRRDEEALLVKIRQAAEQYTVASLARAVLERARERFDAEQQPRVVQRAASVFAELTANRYRQLHPDPRTRQLTVRDAHGASWQIEQLSRGTRELLLLAFRLAVVEDFGQARVALPLLLDDVTVNFDADRAGRVIEVLARLSKRHQILAFTCHSQVRALFREAGARVHEVVQRTQLSLLGA